MSSGIRQIIKILVAITLLAALVYGIWIIRSVIIYVLISAVIALIGKPVVDRLTDKKWRWIKLNRTMAAALTLFIIIGLFGGIMSIFIPSLISELAVLSQLNVEELFASLEENMSQFERFLHLQPAARENSNGVVEEAVQKFLNFDNITNTFYGLLGGLGNILFAIFSILFITFFFMKEEFLFRNIVLALVPDSFEGRIINISPRLKKVLSRYFAGILIQITIITLLISVGLYFIGFENFIAIAFFAGLMNIIPYIGPLIGMAFGLILGLSTNFTAELSMEPIPLALMIIGVFGLVQLIDNFILQPVIFSNSINAHPLDIFLVISIAAVFGGIPGMIVAVPTYSVLRLLAREFFPNVKFIRRLTQNLQPIDGLRIICFYPN